MSMKNSNDTIGNRTRDLPACSAVTQPTAPPAARPLQYEVNKSIRSCRCSEYPAHLQARSKVRIQTDIYCQLKKNNLEKYILSTTDIRDAPGFFTLQT
jgi:hypothetical protein